MIATTPDYIKGDQLTPRQYITAIMNSKHPVYSSLWNWWKKTTAFWCVPLLVGDLALFIALFYQEWKSPDGIDWLMILGMLSILFICFLPLVWAVTYYYSFVSPHKVAVKLSDFIAAYMPGATRVRGISYTNYIYLWKEMEYELAYSLIPAVTAQGKVKKYYPCFIICLHFIPSPEHKSEIVDEDGNILDSVLDDCYAYCKGKESCRMLRMENNSMYVFFRQQDLQNKEIVVNAMEQMQYLTDRFNLIPLYLSMSLGPEIYYWLQINDHPAPEEIVAFNIGIFETEKGYSLHLTGSKTYDPADDDWACNEDFEAEEKYLELPMSNHTPTDWEDFQLLVKTTVRKYVESKAADEHSLFYHKVVTIGFDDGDLILISKGEEKI